MGNKGCVGQWGVVKGKVWASFKGRKNLFRLEDNLKWRTEDSVKEGVKVGFFLLENIEKRFLNFACHKAPEVWSTKNFWKKIPEFEKKFRKYCAAILKQIKF